MTPDEARDQLLRALLVERFTPIPTHPRRKPTMREVNAADTERAAHVRHLRLVHKESA